MSASAPIGEYARIVARRDALLANVSPAARRKLLGRARFFRPVAKGHSITVDCKTLVRKVEPIQSAKAEMPRSCWQILCAVAEAWGVTVADLRAPSRRREFAYPRFAAQLMIRDRNGWSTTKLGKLFGGRDHTTVLSALKRAKALLENDPEYRNRYEAALSALEGK